MTRFIDASIDYRLIVVEVFVYPVDQVSYAEQGYLRQKGLLRGVRQNDSLKTLVVPLQT